MNLVLRSMLKKAAGKDLNGSAQPIGGPIKGEPQDRPLPSDLAEVPDLLYAQTESTQLRANVVFPVQPWETPLPVGVYVHGGGLVIGDRNSDRVFCQELARRGFVVYSLEYRLINKADAFGMVADICRGLTLVRSTLHKYGGDPDTIILFGESAGAFLSLYAAAAGRSETIRRLFQCETCEPKISHLVLFSGMIYTIGGPLGLVYRKALYREKLHDRRFVSIINPDNPQLISALPPVFLVSSKADFLRSHTLRFTKALERAGHSHVLRYYPRGKELTHAFPALMPSARESVEVLETLVKWASEP